MPNTKGQPRPKTHLLAISWVLVLVIAGCGKASPQPKQPSTPETQSVRAVAQAYLSATTQGNRRAVCAVLGAGAKAFYVKHSGSCLNALKGLKPGAPLRVGSVQVHGNAATAEFTDAVGRKRIIMLDKEKGAWKVINGG
jgi:hypothetical protein